MGANLTRFDFLFRGSVNHSQTQPKGYLGKGHFKGFFRGRPLGLTGTMGLIELSWLEILIASSGFCIHRWKGSAHLRKTAAPEVLWGLLAVSLFKEEVTNFYFSLDLFLSLLNFSFNMFGFISWVIQLIMYRKLRLKRLVSVPTISLKLANIPQDDFSWRMYTEKPIRGLASHGTILILVAWKKSASRTHWPLNSSILLLALLIKISIEKGNNLGQSSLEH